MDKVSDGIYLMYVKEGQMYPIILTKDQWDMLQLFANGISNPIKVLDKSLGIACDITK